MGTWVSRGGIRGIRRITPRGGKVLGFFHRHGLVPLNMQETASGPVDTYEGQVNGSTLDYIAVSSILSDLPHTCTVLDWDALNTSDHLPVCAVIRVSGISVTTGGQVPRGHIKCQVRISIGSTKVCWNL